MRRLGEVNDEQFLGHVADVAGQVQDRAALFDVMGREEDYLVEFGTGKAGRRNAEERTRLGRCGGSGQSLVFLLEN